MFASACPVAKKNEVKRPKTNKIAKRGSRTSKICQAFPFLALKLAHQHTHTHAYTHNWREISGCYMLKKSFSSPEYNSNKTATTTPSAASVVLCWSVCVCVCVGVFGKQEFYAPLFLPVQKLLWATFSFCMHYIALVGIWIPCKWLKIYPIVFFFIYIYVGFLAANKIYTYSW